jgi:hypothetical protein
MVDDELADAIPELRKGQSKDAKEDDVDASYYGSLVSKNFLN